MAAYQEPRVSGAQALINGWTAMSQSQLDDAKRQEIAAKGAAQYQGAQSQGGVNTIQFAPGVAQDPGQNATMDQTAGQYKGSQDQGGTSSYGILQDPMEEDPLLKMIRAGITKQYGAPMSGAQGR